MGDEIERLNDLAKQSHQQDWYCPNCGYLSGGRVTFYETCDTCHAPVRIHDNNPELEVKAPRMLEIINEQQQKLTAAENALREVVESDVFRQACRSSDEPEKLGELQRKIEDLLRGQHES